MQYNPLNCKLILKGEYWTCPVCDIKIKDSGHGMPSVNCLKSPEALIELVKLPGYHLHQLIEKCLGQKAVAGCGCGSVMAKMNADGIEGCKAKVDYYAGKLYDTAVKREWLIEPEEGFEVDDLDIGKPVPQTIRTKVARTVARTMALTKAGRAKVFNECRKMVLEAIRLADEESQKAKDNNSCQSS